MTVLGSMKHAANVQLARRDTTVLGSVKRVVNALLSRCGHVVAHRGSIPSFDRLVACLRRASLVPQTVFDIGVAYGTPWLYAAFPDAKFHLVDPTRNSLPHMQTWAKKLNADVHNVALGLESTSMQIATRSTIIHSSLLHNITNPAIQERYDVPVQRFDALFPTFARPALCKIDVEGAELLVLHGMGDRIHDLDAIVIETSLISLYENGPDFREIVKYMLEQQFSSV